MNGWAVLLTVTAVMATLSAPPDEADAGAGRSRVRLDPAAMIATDPAPEAEMLGGPKVVSDDRGVSTVDWTEGGVVKFAQRDRAGTWSAPVSVGCVRPRHDYCYTADLAVDGAGTVTAVWEFEQGRRTGVEVAQHPAGGTWTKPVPLTDERSPNEHDPKVVAARNGAVLVAFEVDGAGSAHSVGVIYRIPHGSWLTASKQRYRDAQTPAIAISDRGGAVLVVHRHEEFPGLRAYRYRPGHGWTLPVRLGTGGWGNFTVAMGPGGRAVAAWVHGGYRVIQARMMSRVGHWRPTVALATSPDGLVDQPHGVIDLHGRTSVVWTDVRAQDTARWATKTPTGPWLHSTAYRGNVVLRDVVGNRDGDLALLMLDTRPGGYPGRIYIGLHPANGRWSARAQLTSANTDSQNNELGSSVGVLPSGAAVAAYVDFGVHRLLGRQASVP